MSQHDMNIANQGFPAFRSDLNNALAALVSNSSGATAPTTTFAHQFWLDTSTTPNRLRQRNADNDAWIEVGRLDQVADTYQAAAVVDGVYTTGNQTIAGTKTFSAAPVVPGLNGGPLAGLRNLIINGSFGVNQRAPATNADDTYAHDRWYALTQTGTIAVTTLTGVENTTPFMARLTQSQATAQRMGYAQIIEGINCKHLRGQTVTFEFGRVRASTSTNIRIAVLEWTGTEDSVTSDVVNSWTNTTYTAGQFFIATNLTVSSVVQQALTANTLTDGSAVTVTLGSSFNNLIVFVWTESAVAQNVTLDLGKAQLEIGGVATPFEHRLYGSELALCQRYFLKPAAFMAGGTETTTVASFGYSYPVSMRAAPTFTAADNDADIRISGSTTTGIAGTWTAISLGTEGAGFTFTRTSGSWTANLPAFLNQTTSIANLSAEL